MLARSCGWLCGDVDGLDTRSLAGHATNVVAGLAYVERSDGRLGRLASATHQQAGDGNAHEDAGDAKGNSHTDSHTGVTRLRLEGEGTQTPAVRSEPQARVERPARICRWTRGSDSVNREGTPRTSGCCAQTPCCTGCSERRKCCLRTRQRCEGSRTCDSRSSRQRTARGRR